MKRENALQQLRAGERRAARRAFTVVELMMSLAVLAVGISGIIAMQKVTAMTNLHSKSVAIATRIANAWENQLLVDGSLWRRSISSSINSTIWLKSASAAGTWIRPAYDATHGMGAGFDALGNPVTETNIQQAAFCVHVQLVPVVPLTNLSNATIRATVRVLWPRVQGDPGKTPFCSGAVAPATTGDDTENFHSIYQTTAIRVHP